MDFQDQLEQIFSRSFESFRRILRYYQCPDSCQANCCKKCDIEFGKHEYKLMSAHHRKAHKILETKTKEVRQETKIGMDLVGYTFTEKPCPLLKKNNKCSIQTSKPVTCELYPFSLSKHPTEKNLVALEPCLMGVNVMADYLLFKCLNVYYSTSLTDTEKESMIKSDLDLFDKSISSSSTMWNVELSTLDMYIHMCVIEPFADFLDENPESKRVLDRIAFGIEQIKTEKVNTSLE